MEEPAGRPVVGPRVPTLIITRGLPASGKSTRAGAWVDDDPAGRVRAGRDYLRRMLHGRLLGTEAQEDLVTKVEHAVIWLLLLEGQDVVCDNTNLNPEYVERLRRLAGRCGANFEVWDMTGVDVEVCVERDRGRTGDDHVGEAVIRDMWARYQQTLTPAP